MNTSFRRPAAAFWAAAGAIALMLGGAGCHSDPLPPPPPVPVGFKPVDSNKPPPDMQRLYEQSHPAPASSH